ncbi:MAG: CPBP family intramembrane metalloprotease [Elusimicrobia bacterium]|nr:CPBP family intramembrane metalloprotease [Elusimicrobiota bacterium]
MMRIDISGSQTIPRGKSKEASPRGTNFIFLLCALSVMNWTLPYLCSLALKPVFALIPLYSNSGSVPLLINLAAQIFTITGLTFTAMKVSGLNWSDIGFTPGFVSIKYILGGVSAGAIYGMFVKFSDYHPAVWAKGIPGILMAARIVIISPFLEELFCRGLLFRLLEQEVGPRVNIFMNALIYALAHYHFVEFLGYLGLSVATANPTTWGAILVYFVLGAICAFIRHRSKSIWPAISTHLTYNLMLFLL